MHAHTCSETNGTSSVAQRRLRTGLLTCIDGLAVRSCLIMRTVSSAKPSCCIGGQRQKGRAALVAIGRARISGKVQ